MPKPATGKTQIRTLRAADDVWLPALARAEAEGIPLSEVLVTALRDYGAGQLPGAREFNYANWPEGAQWGRRHAEALGDLRDDLGITIAEDIELIPAEWLTIAAWLASTHHPGDPAQQKRVITGHVLRRLLAQPEGPHRDRFRDSRHLSETVQAILERHLPLVPDD